MFLSFLLLLGIRFPSTESWTQEQVCQLYTDSFGLDFMPYYHKCAVMHTNEGQCAYADENEDDIANAFKRMNMFRRILGMNDIVRIQDDENHANIMRDTCMCLNANRKISHYIDESYSCYTQNASYGALRSNLHMNGNGVCVSTSIDEYLLDTNVPELGHRRYILSHTLAKTYTCTSEIVTAMSVNFPDSRNLCA